MQGSNRRTGARVHVQHLSSGKGAGFSEAHWRVRVCAALEQRQQCAFSLTLTSLPPSAMRLHCMLVIFSQLAGSLPLYLSPMYFLMAARLEPERCVGGVAAGWGARGRRQMQGRQKDQSARGREQDSTNKGGVKAGSKEPQKSTLADRERGTGGMVPAGKHGSRYNKRIMMDWAEKQAKRDKSGQCRKASKEELGQQHKSPATAQGPCCTRQRLPYPPQRTRLAPNSPQKNWSIGQSRPHKALVAHANESQHPRE